jgi:hypothetical protein
MAEIYLALVANRTRLEQIVDDVLTASETGANILVLTTWVEHLNAITGQLLTAGKTVTVLSGGMKARERRQIVDQLANHTPDSPSRTAWCNTSVASPVPTPRRSPNRARLPRRAHHRHRLIAEETNTRLPQDGFPRPAQDEPVELNAADRRTCRTVK